MNQLTVSESSRLKSLEKIIKAGEKTFIEVGLALTEIRDEKLYRAEHGSFEKYMDRVWGWSKQHGYRLIEAAHVAKEHPRIVTQAAANALAKVPPPKRAAVVAAIPAKPTAPAVRKASALPPTKPATTFLDATGLEIPPEVQTLWNRLLEAQHLCTQISVVRSALRKAQDEKDKLFVEVDFTDNLAKLNQVYIDLKRAIPFAICPSCNGVEAEGCATCKERGFVSQFYWDHNVPAETKTLTGRK